MRRTSSCSCLRPHVAGRRRRPVGGAGIVLDGVPLTGRQARAVLSSGARELGWGLGAVSREVDRWRLHAAAIPDARLRDEALRGLDQRRGYIDGAALLWTLPVRRDRTLLRLLVAYEVMQDYLDGVSERGARAGAEDGTALFQAVSDALDLSRSAGSVAYCRDLPWATTADISLRS